MKALGFYDTEVASYVYKENVLLDVYKRQACSYSLYVLGSCKGEDRRMNGINNLFKKSMVTIKSVINLLAAGNSCDAVILWRHLHELECVLIVLCTKDVYKRQILRRWRVMSEF